jgi:opacity protein-like surface antigen
MEHRLTSIVCKGVLLLAGGATILPLHAQRHEIGVLFGGFQPQDRNLTGAGNSKALVESGFAISAAYAVRWKQWRAASLHVEIPFVASPQHRIQSARQSLTRDIATLYLTPGLKVRFAPHRRVTPYLAAGAGYALFEHSTARIDGAANTAPRHLHRGAFQFGGGVEVKLLRFLALRIEARDFVSGNPAFHSSVAGSRQHNLLLAGGFAIRR